MPRSFIATLKTRFAISKKACELTRDLIVAPKFLGSEEYLYDLATEFSNDVRIIPCVSDDAIARNLVAACEVERPNFACAQFSGAAVYEHVSGADIVELAEFTKNEGISESTAYMAYLTAELRVINLLKNILLVQEYLSAKRIPYRLITPLVNREQLHPVAAILVELLNLKFIVEDETRRAIAKSSSSRTWIEHSNQRSNRDPNIYPLW
jgi:hypothetical protein